VSTRGNLHAARGARVAGVETLSALTEPFAAIELAAQECALEDLPEIEGRLGRLRGLLSVRYAQEPRPAIAAPSEERLLSVEEAAGRLSKTPDWLYHHHRALPFAVKVGAHLRFSESGLNSWIRERMAPTARPSELPSRRTCRIAS
jgi:predicted DNA-binding transcriptional regulator AlpA